MHKSSNTVLARNFIIIGDIFAYSELIVSFMYVLFYMCQLFFSFIGPIRNIVKNKQGYGCIPSGFFRCIPYTLCFSRKLYYIQSSVYYLLRGLHSVLITTAPQVQYTSFPYFTCEKFLSKCTYVPLWTFTIIKTFALITYTTHKKYK